MKCSYSIIEGILLLLGGCYHIICFLILLLSIILPENSNSYFLIEYDIRLCHY